MPCVVTAWVVPIIESQNSGFFKNSDCSFLWGAPNYFENVFILQVHVSQDPWISGRVWHREPFSLWVQFCYLVLFFLGLFLSPCVEDGLNLFSDLRRGFRIVDSSTILIVNLFPILVV